jgi:RNA recognition motif-containing protein
MTKPIQEPIQKFYFICFNDPDNNSQEYGPRCAAKAVEELNGKEYKGQNLHVVPALKNNDRKKELEHATLNYKTSKKRCNLYVKGFYSENED